MNLRDRLVPNKEEESYIKFTIENHSATWETDCTREELANRLANIVNIAYKMAKDNFDEDVQKEIISKWMMDLKDLFLKDE